MATPWTFDQRIAAYKAAGIKNIVVYKSAKTHNRDGATGKVFGPVYGLTVHHTAGVGSGMKDVCYNGVSGLPGPLCHDFLAKDGTLYVIGHGRTNHAGTVTPAVRDAIIAEKAPVASMRNGSETIDGNDFLFGLEIENRGDGSDPYPAVQYDVAVRWAYAHLKYYGWSANSAWGHKEITSRKIDPSFPKGMGQFRADVSEMLGGGDAPGGDEEDVALSADDIKKVAQAVWALDDIPAPKPPYNNSDYLTGNVEWSARYALCDAVLRARQLRAEVKELAAKVDGISVGGIDLDALAAKVADLLAARLAD